jgi:hypothetical protein
MGIERIRADLAPGDVRAREFDFDGFEIRAVANANDRAFGDAYRFLWEEFGAKNEIEPKDILARRLARDPAAVIRGYSFFYQMLVVRKGGQIAAVRDHTAIVRRDAPPAATDDPVVVHLSHLLIARPFRATGLTAWMRALPIQAARQFGPSRPITLLAEMEHPDPKQPETLARLKSYQKAGFLKVDPSAVDYHQPDFRPFAEIDAAGGPRPLAFALILRRVGREDERLISADELRATVGALYTMYGLEFRAPDMKVVLDELAGYPTSPVALVEPML